MLGRTARVALYTLGGTIAMTSRPDGTVAPALSAHDLLNAVPQHSELDLAIDVHDFRALPGASSDSLTCLRWRPRSA